MIGTKKYLQPKDMLLNAVHDLAELQKGKTELCDTSHGLVNLTVTMYGEEINYEFSVADIGSNRSEVNITLNGEHPNKKRLIYNEFALLDYVMIDRARADLTEVILLETYSNKKSCEEM